MKINLSAIFATLWLAMAASSAQALSILQDLESGANQIRAFQPSGQSFNATDGNIGSVGVYIDPFNQSVGDLSFTMAIFSGSGDFSAGAQLLSQEMVLTVNYMGWVDLDVSGVVFNAGENYTIGLFNDTSQWGYQIQRSGDPYSGGTAFVIGVADADGDLRFRVQPAGVPIPGTLGLFGLGLLALGFRRKSPAIQ